MNEARARTSTLVLILLLIAEVAVLVALIANFLSVYFVIGDGEPRLTQGAVVGYQLLAGVAIALTVAGMIVGFAGRRPAWGIAHVVVLLVVLGSAAVFAVPRVSDAPPSHTPLPSNYVPCLSGSNTCPGG